MDKDMHYGSDYHYIPMTSLQSGVGVEVLSDLYCYTIQVVNIHFVGLPDENEFILVDAGMPNSANKIITATEKRFGANSRPKAIVLTHGHFDHVGAAVDLVDHWEVPVYAHELEIPYLTGEMSYPEPDATVEGGAVAKMSPMFPNEPINLGKSVKVLPSDGTVPDMLGFKWIHTPGHSPGHVSFFRESDRALISGDALITVKQDSLLKVMSQQKELSGPPRYLTTDWKAAKASVEKLAKLKPVVAVTGHGVPMVGKELTDNIEKLVEDFDNIAIPDYGKYISKNDYLH